MQEDEYIDDSNKAVRISEPGLFLGFNNSKVAPVVITGANPKIRIYPINWFHKDVPIFI